MQSYQYRNSHCKNKTILWPSYVHNGISCTHKAAALYWIRALVTESLLTQCIKRHLYSLSYTILSGITGVSSSCHHTGKNKRMQCRYNMMTPSNGNISALLALCEGNSPVLAPHKSQWRGALMFSLICVCTNSWANNGDAGDLRRHGAHYDVIVMKMSL